METSQIDRSVAGDHSRFEHALADVSHLLVSSSKVDVREVLRIVGEAVGAECAYLALAPFEEEPPPEAAVLERPLLLWHRNGLDAEVTWATAERVGTSALFKRALQDAEPGRSNPACHVYHVYDRAGGTIELAIPLLTKHDRFIGHLGVERPTLPGRELREHGRILSVFGDLLAGYFSRIATEQALRESEERWRKLVAFHPEPIFVTVGDAILYANEASARLLGANSPEDLLEYSLRDFIPADQQDAFEQRRASQLTGTSSSPVEHEIIRLDGEERTVETVSVAAPFRGLAAVQTVMRDLTQRKESAERYSTFVQTISEGIWRVDLTRPISTEAAAHLQVQHVLRYGYLAESNATMTRLLGAEDPNEIVGRPVRALLPQICRSLTGTFIAQGYRFQNFEFSVPQENDQLRHFSINAVGRIERGALVRIWGSCVDITERTETERQMVAVLEEQQERIGRDLHDGVGQLLTGIRMLSDNFVARHSRAGDGTEVLPKKIASYAEEASQRVRDICRGLAPPQLYQEGLAAALEGLAANVNALSDGVIDDEASSYVTCTFIRESEADIEERETKLQLFRIAQEAINNALKHARPRAVRVRLATEDHHLVLEISDDGCGFDVKRHSMQSLGLFSMHRRASSVRATLAIESEPEAGTRIRVVLPV